MGRWIIAPLWRPKFRRHRYRIRAPSEPFGLLGGVGQAALLVRRDAKGQIGEAASELAHLHLGDARMSELDVLYSKEKQP